MMRGDTGAVESWQRAISQYRDFASRFKGRDLVQALTSIEQRSGQTVLKVAPEDAANFIMGRTTAGWTTKTNLTRDLVQVRELLGADSDAWNALRQEFFLRLARGEQQAVEGSGQAFSGQKFANAWNAANRDNRAMLETLFSADERALIDQFADVASQVSRRVPYNTAADLANIMQNLGGLFPRIGAALGNSPVFRWARNLYRQDQATRAASGRPTAAARPSAMPGTGPGLLGQVGGWADSQ
jgi:hypothetical protein